MVFISWESACIFFLSYVVGAIPCGAWISRLHGVNILQSGSGSSGATNVKREVGKAAGNLVFCCDALKGFLVAILGRTAPPVEGYHWRQLAMICLLLAMFGHCFSIFLKFRGGKGMAVTIGGLLFLMPNVLFVGMLTWAAVFFSTRFVSLASICCCFIMPFCTYLFAYDCRTFFLTFFLCA
ncbi:MAG: glycerol-3-phosphate acyltransferase, partial [Puniceicoccales bacterium]|nr:glycerol-3-phosphate acyltransferase [Puniceicoccales bacterium]